MQKNTKRKITAFTALPFASALFFLGGIARTSTFSSSRKGEAALFQKTEEEVSYRKFYTEETRDVEKGEWAKRENERAEKATKRAEKEKATNRKEEATGAEKENTAGNPYGWERLSSYTTYYSAEEKGRCQNIAVAAALVDGVTLQAYGEFSFNKTVGERTKEAGFRDAKIIVNGEYVEGVGGGVCQVSTTLYNAALKSGLEILEYHPHSLRVSYIPPSRDAMVSSGSDLRIFNPYDTPVYLAAEVFKGGIRVTFYGKNEGYRYEISSSVLGEIPPPEPIIKEGDVDEIIRSPKNGIKSEAYLEKYRGEQLLFRKRLRVDEYRPVQGIIGKKIAKGTN